MASMKLNLFSNWELLYRITSIQLNIQFDNSKRQARVDKLCNAVRNLYNGSNSVDVHVFGSHSYGLATENSDIDLYLDIGGTFDGKISNKKNKQIHFIKEFAESCSVKYNEFNKVEQICNARVPIIRFYHVPTQLNCDVSFKSGLSLYNSKLIKYYLSMHRNVMWLAYVVLKHWAPQYNLKDKNVFTSYAMVWLVLFYLMTENVVPSLAELRKYADTSKHKIIEGWDCTFGKCIDNIKTTKDCRRLLLGFFQYYKNEQKLANTILCPINGKCMNKLNFFNQFIQLPEISETQQTTSKTFLSNIKSNFENHCGLAVQDPFELSFNLTRNITGVNFTEFCIVCDESATLLNR